MVGSGERWVVVGMDSRNGELRTLEVAAAEARRRGLPLLLLTAHPRAGHEGPHTSLTTLLRHVHASWPEVRADARNLSGDPVDELIEESRSAALVVLGRRAEDQQAGRSVSSQVAAHGFSPTLVVPPDAVAPDRGPVLLGLGLSGDDDAAIGFAFEEASLRRVPLLAAHVWAGMPAAALTAVDPFAYDLRQAQDGTDRILAETLAGWTRKYPDVPVERMPLHDASPARALLAAGKPAGLLVVGTRRHARRSSQLLGTVTRHLIDHCRRPVAVVHPAPR